MVNTRNEHVFPKENEWIVKREGNTKISRFFENKKDAMEYAGIIASKDGGSVVSHKYNGQFNGFKHGNEVHVKRHKIASIIAGTTEIVHPVVNNVYPIIETTTST